jgi:hypothetical protein
MRVWFLGFIIMVLKKNQRMDSGVWPRFSNVLKRVKQPPTKPAQFSVKPTDSLRFFERTKIDGYLILIFFTQKTGLAILRFWNIKETETDGPSKIEITAQHWFVPVANLQSNASSQQSLTYPTHCWLDNMRQGNMFISVIAWSGVINWIWRCISVVDDSQSRWCKSWSKWNRNISVKLRPKLEQALWHRKGACPWTTARVQAAAPTKVDANKSFWAKLFYWMFNLIHNNIMYGFSVSFRLSFLCISVWGSGPAQGLAGIKLDSNPLPLNLHHPWSNYHIWGAWHGLCSQKSPSLSTKHQPTLSSIHAAIVDLLLDFVLKNNDAVE